MFVILLLLSVVTLFYVWLKWNYSHWKRNKVAGPEPHFITGNMGPTLNFTKHWGEVTMEWYKKYSNEPYIGYFKMLKPAILVRDADLVKDVMIKDFDYFSANDMLISEKYDPLMATNPFFSIDDKWKESRKTIIPAFSSSKIKSILPVMNSVGNELIDFIKSHPSGEEFDAKKLSNRFTTQNVIRCTFSIDAGCFDKSHQCEFLEAGEKMFSPSFWVGLKFLLMPLIPNWAGNMIPIPFVSKEIDTFFRQLIVSNKASRTVNHQSNDILQMLLHIQKKHNIRDEDFLPGHAMALFGDGTETSSTAMFYALYELAMNPSAQDKLHDEIVETLNKTDGELTAEAMQDMIYLEGVLHETMRIHPPLMVMQKLCTKDYELPKTSHQSTPITIRPGTAVNIPVQAIHMDPKYYPEPEEFKPERFFPEEQKTRHNGTYLSFGEGPRICLGMRFAIAQVKTALALIVKNFHIKLSPNQKPIVIDTQTLLSYPKDGIFLQFESR